MTYGALAQLEQILVAAGHNVVLIAPANNGGREAVAITSLVAFHLL